MTAASMTNDPKDEKDIVDDLFGEAPEDHPDDLPGADEPDSDSDKPEPIAAKAEPEDEPVVEETESEADAGADDDDGAEEPGNLRLPEKGESAKGEEKPEVELSDADKRLAAEEKRSAGLQKELAKMRAERRQAEQRQQQAANQPPPLASQVPPSGVVAPAAAAVDGRIPVVVSEDGQSVYVDEAKLAERMHQTAQSAYVEAMKPTPEQVSADKERQLAQSFVSQDRERNEPIYIAARDAENFIFESVTAEARKQGIAFNSIPQVQEFIHQSGIGDKVREFFPVVAPLMDEFVAAGMADNPTWKRSVLDRMGGQPALSADPIADSGGGSAPIEPISGAPSSLSRKGAGRSVSPNADEAEYAALEKRFRADAIFFPEKDEKRMNSLGRKLGITGME